VSQDNYRADYQQYRNRERRLDHYDITVIIICFVKRVNVLEIRTHTYYAVGNNIIIVSYNRYIIMGLVCNPTVPSLKIIARPRVKITTEH